MAKRFTDTDKWKKAWYCDLGSKFRDVWQYLLDNCDNAGVWELNLRILEFYIGEPVSLQDMAEKFGARIVVVGDKLFIPAFIDFQYGELSEDFL